jgi:hypothetical protein
MAHCYQDREKTRKTSKNMVNMMTWRGMGRLAGMRPGFV